MGNVLELICHTDLYMKDQDGNELPDKPKTLSFGVIYEVVQESQLGYTIKNNQGREHYFTKYPDEYGESYANWLNILQDEEE